MAPKPSYIRDQMRPYTEEITGSAAGPGLRLTFTLDIYADGSVRIYSVPAGERGWTAG
jgi:hypothetical protein